jgi:homoserine dehydrogenase
VGTGVARILIEKGGDIRRETGLEFQSGRGVRALQGFQEERRSRSRACESRPMPRSILRDPTIDQVVELIGGLNPAGAHIADALKSGQDVVSANKALFAERGLGAVQARASAPAATSASKPRSAAAFRSSRASSVDSRPTGCPASSAS